MPPQRKKKAKAGAAPGTPSEAVVPASIDAVSAFQRDVSLTVELMYSLRHGADNARKRPLEGTQLESGGSDTSVPQPDSDGCYPFPLCKGGTFMEIAQRAQTCDGAVEVGWLAKESAEFCAAAGLLDTADPMEFLSQFVVAKAQFSNNTGTTANMFVQFLSCFFTSLTYHILRNLIGNLHPPISMAGVATRAWKFLHDKCHVLVLSA